MNYSLGIDIGTSSAKGVLFREKAIPVAQATAEYDTKFPNPNWAQQDPNDWWKAVISVIKDILGQPNISPEEIKVVSISCQAPTVLLLDKNGNPTYDAIIWMDRRSDKECEQLDRIVGRERIFEITGTRLDPYYVYPELLWVKNNKPEALEKAEVLLQVNGYINYKLTGVYSIDPVHASHTQMYDVKKHCWSKELFDAIGVSETIYPDVFECTEKIGEVSSEAARLTGLSEGTAVLCGTVDGAAAVLEAGVVGGGEAVEMTGTSSGLMIAFDEFTAAKTMAHQYSIVPGKHILYGAMSTSGASYKWVRDQLYDHDHLKEQAYRLMDEEIIREAPNPTDIVFLPYMQGERCPIWDTNAKGVFMGLTLGTNRAQIMRATLEGVCFALRNNVDEARKVGVEIKSLCSVGGCSNSALWTRIKASILNIPISVPKHTMGAPGGLALMMAVYLGEFQTLEEAAEKCRQEAITYEPVNEWVEKYNRLYAVFCNCYPALKNQFKLLADL